MTLPRITVVGDALIDEIHDAQGGVHELVGGAALNLAVGIARLGGDTTLVAMVGDDEAGDAIRQHLAEHGVRLVETPSEHGTSRAVATRNEHGEPQYEFSLAARKRHIAFEQVPDEVFSEADVVAVSCFPFDDVEQTRELLRAAALAPRLAIDPNPRAGNLRDAAEFVAGFERAAAQADLVKFGDEDAALLYGVVLDEVKDRLREAGARIVVATRGADGATITTPEVTVSRGISHLPGPIVDTIGAGDASFASILSSLASDPPADEAAWDRALLRAMDIAAATCRSEGALLQLP